MNIAELFISLGVKGSDKTVGALTGMQKGLKDTSSAALETKVALVGAMYALERLFAASGQKGTDLTNLNSLLGVSSKTLQQYEYAARQVGISNDEMDGTFKALQATMTKTMMGEGAPKGMALVSQLTGGISADDVKKFSEHPEMLVQKLQQAAQEAQKRGMSPGLINEAIKSFGVGENVISGFRRNAFRPEVLNKAPTYSDREVGSLDKANIAWSNLGNKIQMAIGHFNARHGNQLVGDISKIVDKVVKLAEAFTKLSEKIKLFELLGKIVEGWTQIFDGLESSLDGVVEAIDSIKEAFGNPKKAGELAEKVGSGVKNFVTKDLPNVFGFVKDEIFGGGDRANHLAPPVANAAGLVKPSPILPRTEKAISPTSSPSAPKAENQQTINVNQNLNFQHDGKDATKTGDSTKRAIKDAFRQIPAQAQGS